MFEVHTYIGVDTISAKPTPKWFGYVLECEVSGKTETREGFGQILGTYHQAILMAMTEAMGRLNQSCEVYLHTEDEFVLFMIERNLETWAENEFLTTKGKPVANQEEWIQLWQLAQKQLILTVPGKHVYSGWLSSEIHRRKEQQECLKNLEN
ncbi:hypothetical protein [Diplocloster hominis]|uniref:hypothetical protein n=1 Tax=Diplocloster hominis TaxID=3079010 RepID=UPI0031BA3BBC